MQHIAGVHGQDLIAAGHAAAVLRSCGRTLRQVQSVAAADVFDDLPAGSPVVLVHGDYGPNNMLFDPVTVATAAVLDWEWAHPGEPVEDLAWCEWIIRMHHPEAVDELDNLFDGYGGPPWLEPTTGGHDGQMPLDARSTPTGRGCGLRCPPMAAKPQDHQLMGRAGVLVAPHAIGRHPLSAKSYPPWMTAA
jgi:hypothetical protein